jgi:type II secretion system protein N
MKGDLSGTVTWSMPEGKLSRSNGKIDLTISSLSIGDGKAKLKGAIALPRMKAGNVRLQAKATRGKLTISKFAAKGRDLLLSSTGHIVLKDIFAQSKVDIFLKFKFTDKYRSKNEKTKALFGAPGSKAPALFEMADPKIKRAKTRDGFYSWRIWGLMRNPRYDPAPRGPSRSRASGRKRSKRWPGAKH